MRLPFGLGRRSGSVNGASDGDADASSGADKPAAGARPAAGPSRAWAGLPPIQRTAGDMPLVAAPATFAEGLPGSHALPPIVQPLGHEVSSLATPGLVVARTRAVEAVTSQAIPAPVQRRAGRGSRSTAVPMQPQMPVAAAEAFEQMAHDEPALAAPAPVSPIRTLPTVSRLTIRMPDRPLTSASIAARPAAVQRAAAAAAAASAGDGALPRAASGGMRRVPAALPAVVPTVSREASTPHPAPSSPTAPPADAQPARRGVGAPVLAVPASARPIGAGAPPTVSRATTAGPMPIVAASLRTGVQRSAASAVTPASAGALPALGSGAHAREAPLQAGPSLPVLPLLTGDRASRAFPSPSADPGAGPTSAPAVQAMPATPIRPIAAANPIKPSFALQRSASEDDAGEVDDAALPSPWWAPASDPEPARSAFGGAGLDSNGPAGQRSAAAAFTSPGAASFAGTSARSQASQSSPAAVPLQRSASRPGRSLPPARRAAPDAGPRSLDAPAAAGPAAVRTITFPAAAVGIVAEPVVQTSPSAPGGGASATVGPASNLAPGPTVQRASEAPAPGASAQPSGAGAAHSERDLDELAQALFGRIRGRLRNDLIHDREAKGLTFDNV